MSEMLSTDQWKAKAAGLSLQNKAFIGGQKIIRMVENPAPPALGRPCRP